MAAWRIIVPWTTGMSIFNEFATKNRIQFIRIYYPMGKEGLESIILIVSVQSYINEATDGWSQNTWKSIFNAY